MWFGDFFKINVKTSLWRDSLVKVNFLIEVEIGCVKKFDDLEVFFIHAFRFLLLQGFPSSFSGLKWVFFGPSGSFPYWIFQVSFNSSVEQTLSQLLQKSNNFPISQNFYFGDHCKIATTSWTRRTIEQH